MSRLRFPAVALAFALATACAVPPPESSSIRENVERLASDEFGGRLTGTDGIRLAADHIVTELQAIGAVPLPGADGFRLSFDYTGSTQDGGTSLAVDGVEATETGAVQALSFSESGQATGPLVFAGYGLVVPEVDGFSYDSYATLDVTDKIVVVLRYFPEDAETDIRAALSRYAGLRFKAQAARQRGALGLLVVTGPRSPNAGELVRMTGDTAAADSGIVAASVDQAMGDTLFDLVAGRTLEEVQAELDSGNPHVAGFDMGAEATLEVQVVREQRTGHNVVADLPETTEPLTEQPYVMLGAHYDHLGLGEGGNSLATGDDAGQIHNGADDNASGVAAVLSAGGELAGHRAGRQGVGCAG